MNYQNYWKNPNSLLQGTPKGALLQHFFCPSLPALFPPLPYLHSCNKQLRTKHNVSNTVTNPNKEDFT